MVVLRPSEVWFGDEKWDGVLRISIDRSAKSVIEEYGDDGGEVVFADVGRRKTGIRIVQEIVGEMIGGVKPGDFETLMFRASAGSDAHAVRVEVSCMVESVFHKLSDFGATRSVNFIGVSIDGVADPVEVIDV